MSATVDRRAQLVLAAAAVAALALAPAVLAYLQFGYHADVRAAGGYDAPLADAERALGRAVHETGADATATYPWHLRESAARQVRRDMAPRIGALERSRIAAGSAYEVEYNRWAARRLAREACPGGPARQFGECVAVDGVVLQERSGEVHVLAVALDVTVVTDRGEARATFLVPVVEGTLDRTATE